MYKHKTVLLQEAVQYLNVKEGEKYVDCTLGGGGHTSEILRRSGLVLAIDLEKEAIESARKQFKTEVESGDLHLWQGNFAELDKAVSDVSWNQGQINGILFDLGVSTFQLKEAKRGFSFDDETVLDMRMDKSLSVKAIDLIKALSEKELGDLFMRFGEEPQAKVFAKALRSSNETTARGLAEVIKKASKYKHSRIHPATRVFQALRIAVNSELENLETALGRATVFLKPEGRLVVISFHALEDKLAKNLKLSPAVKEITKKPVVPLGEEVRSNPSSRSAKMRVFEKI